MMLSNSTKGSISHWTDRKIREYYEVYQTPYNVLDIKKIAKEIINKVLSDEKYFSELSNYIKINPDIYNELENKMIGMLDGRATKERVDYLKKLRREAKNQPFTQPKIPLSVRGVEEEIYGKEMEQRQ